MQLPDHYHDWPWQDVHCGNLTGNPHPVKKDSESPANKHKRPQPKSKNNDSDKRKKRKAALPLH